MSEPQGFFRDLRALRAGAGLSLTELAQRAHFPRETLAAAENGPVMPGNPVLVAYVRGCGGDVGEWEDRWREASGAAPAVAPVARRRPVWRLAAIAAAAALVSGAAVGVLARPAEDGGHGATRHRPVVPPSLVPGQRALPARPSPPAPPRVTAIRQVAGVGCPASTDDGVALVAVKPGPPWVPAGGGWNGDGCDGGSVWTMDPSGKEPVPPTFTWFFRDAALSRDAAGVSQCTLSVFVPAQNALGRASYAVFGGPRGRVAAITVDQAAEAGQWVVLGSFPGSEYEIQLMPGATLTASDGNPDRGRNAAIAASAAAIACSGSVNSGSVNSGSVNSGSVN